MDIWAHDAIGISGWTVLHAKSHRRRAKKVARCYLLKLRVRDKAALSVISYTKPTGASTYDDSPVVCAMMNDPGTAPNPTKGIGFWAELRRATTLEAMTETTR